MSILIDETTRVIVQGFTGDKATFHAREMIGYGTRVVGGVTPGKGGQTHLELPVFNTVKDAVRETGAEASLAFVPPAYAADALMEAADAALRLVCIITDGIPAQDMMRVKRYLRRYPKDRRTTIVGPNCAGIISAGKAMLGIMPSHIYVRGSVGVVSRSGTLGYEAGAQMKALGIGITTSVGIGGDPINGSSFLDHLMLFECDPETRAVVMIGEIGGPQESEAASWVEENMTKPVIGYVAGLTAPKGRRMGHAGAIISAEGDSAAEKAEIMKSVRSAGRSERRRARRHGGAGARQGRLTGAARARPAASRGRSCCSTCCSRWSSATSRRRPPFSGERSTAGMPTELLARTSAGTGHLVPAAVRSPSRTATCAIAARWSASAATSGSRVRSPRIRHRRRGGYRRGRDPPRHCRAAHPAGDHGASDRCQACHRARAPPADLSPLARARDRRAGRIANGRT